MGKHKPPEKMPRCERAKQFMPFSALKGLEEALAEKEKIVVEKKELSEDMAASLNRRLKLLHKKRRVELCYFGGGEYRRIRGEAQLEPEAGVIKIDGIRIPVADLWALEILD